MTWIAAMVILLGALAPTVSRWLATSSPATPGWLALCTSGPGQAAKPTAQGAPDDPAPAMGMDHCPLCTLQAQALGLPPAVPLVLHLRVLSDAPPSWRVRASAARPDWAVARARAPPATPA